jgi:hypothetical protein
MQQGPCLCDCGGRDSGGRGEFDGDASVAAHSTHKVEAWALGIGILGSHRSQPLGFVADGGSCSGPFATAACVTFCKKAWHWAACAKGKARSNSIGRSIDQWGFSIKRIFFFFFL